MYSDELLNFHLSCKDEYIELIKHFNLLFYGYGCKEELLKQIFPSAIVFNCNLMSLQVIWEEIYYEFAENKKTVSLAALDDFLFKEKRTVILILLNFNFDYYCFSNLKAIKIIGTIESIDINYSMEDIEKFNFIFRDLTTFLDYTDDILGFTLNNSKVTNAFTVYKSVAFKCQKIFKTIIDKCITTIPDLFNNVKKELLLTKKIQIKPFLAEFIENKILKMEGDKISIMLNKTEIEKMRTLIKQLEICSYK